MNFVGIIFVIYGILTASVAQAGGYNISGKIIKPDGTPFSSQSVDFIIEMTNTTGSCSLYKEQHTVDMLETKGAFHIVFGEGTRVFPTTGALTVDASLFNDTSFSCFEGATFTPAPQDERAVKITFYDGQAWQIFSQQTLKSVPSATLAKYASSAESALTAQTAQTAQAVASFQASNLLRSSTSTLPDLDATGAASLQSLITRYTDIKNIIDGTAATYLKTETDPLVKTFAKSSLPACGAGQVLTTTDGINLTCMTPPAGGGGVSLPTGTNGEFLRHDGADWLAATIAISDVQSLTSQLSLLQTSKQDKTGFPACGAYQQLVFSTPADTWSCVAIPLLGDVSGTTGTSTVVKIQGIPVSSSIPANGHVLMYNGSQWMPTTPPGGSAGTVTTISTGTGLTGGPITVSGTISLTNTGVAASTYGAATAVPTITIDAQGRITAASNTTISISGITASGDLTGTYSAPTVSKIRGYSVAATAPSEGTVMTYKSGAWTPTQLGCPSGWTIVNRGEPFCIKYLGTSLTYASATTQCGNYRANICNMQQLMHADDDAKLFSGNTNILLDQLHSNSTPLFFTPSSVNISPGGSLSDSGNAHCCRRQEY